MTREHTTKDRFDLTALIVGMNWNMDKSPAGNVEYRWRKIPTASDRLRAITEE